MVIVETEIVNKLTYVRWQNGSELACAACYLGPEGLLHNANLCRSACCIRLTGYLRYWWEFLMYSTSNAMHWQVLGRPSGSHNVFKMQCHVWYRP